MIHTSKNLTNHICWSKNIIKNIRYINIEYYNFTISFRSWEMIQVSFISEGWICSSPPCGPCYRGNDSEWSVSMSPPRHNVFPLSPWINQPPLNYNQLPLLPPPPHSSSCHPSSRSFTLAFYWYKIYTDRQYKKYSFNFCRKHTCFKH